MTVKTISPTEAKQLVQNGAILIDIRSAEEYRRERIDGALNVSADQLPNALLQLGQGKVFVFYCLSGTRTQMNKNLLEDSVSHDAYIVEGGLNNWKREGLTTEKNASEPISIFRQVQIIAGSLILLGCLLGYLVSPKFFLLAGFVGAGLVFAGVSGFCGMAVLLMKMPWNKTGASCSK